MLTAAKTTFREPVLCVLFQLGKGKESFVVPGLPVQGLSRGSRSLLIVSLYEGDNERPGPQLLRARPFSPAALVAGGGGARRGGADRGGGGAVSLCD